MAGEERLRWWGGGGVEISSEDRAFRWYGYGMGHPRDARNQKACGVMEGSIRLYLFLGGHSERISPLLE